ncbi:MAG: AmmeMemoRadiSam system protein B [Phycisphaerales bacterium]
MSDQHPAGETPQPPGYDPTAPHHAHPKLRPVRGFAQEVEGQQLLGLADAQQISSKVVMTSPAFQLVLPHLNGQNDLEAVIEKVGRGLQRTMLEEFVARLDAAALIEGPNFDALLLEMRRAFDASDTLPPGPTADFADALVMQEKGQDASDDEKRSLGPEKLTEILDQWINELMGKVKDPSFDTLPRAVIVPGVDYGRGWLNYASVYGRMRVVDRPDRIVLLGTNHFGMATGVAGCDKGFSSPIGESPYDTAMGDALKDALGSANAERLFNDRYDHEREHCIELQMPWIHHVFADTNTGEHPPVFAALIHDPMRNSGKSYDGNGLDLDVFVEGLGKAIGSLPGRTLLICVADLSHVGPAFGDQVKLLGDEEQTKQFRNEVIQHDRAMTQIMEKGAVDELMASMMWQQNKTRWGGLGPLIATMSLFKGEPVKLLNYAAAADPSGTTMVSTIAASIE